MPQMHHHQAITLNGQQIYLTQSPLNQPIIIQQAGTNLGGPNSPVLIQQLPSGGIQLAGVKHSPQLLIYPNQGNGPTATNPQPFQQTHHVNMQPTNTLPYDYPQQPSQPVHEGPRQVQHREAYQRYIANLKRTHQIQHSPAANNPIANAANAQQSDWYAGLDVVRAGGRIREKRVQAPGLAWVENCPSEDILQHLCSLRYHLLNDALNIRKENDDNDECEKIVEENDNELAANSSEPMLVE